MFRRHPFLSLVTLVYLGVVAWITLGPQPINRRNGYWFFTAIEFFGAHRSTEWLTYTRVEFIANIAMFVPIGVFFLLLFGRRLWLVSVIAGVALTFGIEGAQLFIPGRVTDIRDIESNTLGAVIGVLVALVLTAGKSRRIRRKRARERQARGNGPTGQRA